jgi:hypothetical protein
MTRSKLLPLALALTALSPAAAMAAKNPTPDGAMRKGVADFVKFNAEGGRASKIDIRCKPENVKHKAACAGTFRVTLDGRTATYKLTSKARTLRLSPSAIEYRLSARAIRKAAGLPSHADMAGFLQ